MNDTINTGTNTCTYNPYENNCHVQVLRNSITGEVSVGWWREKE